MTTIGNYSNGVVLLVPRKRKERKPIDPRPVGR